jgi:hypothetical protein
LSPLLGHHDERSFRDIHLHPGTHFMSGPSVPQGLVPFFVPVERASHRLEASGSLTGRRIRIVVVEEVIWVGSVSVR